MSVRQGEAIARTNLDRSKVAGLDVDGLPHFRKRTLAQTTGWSQPELHTAHLPVKELILLIHFAHHVYTASARALAQSCSFGTHGAKDIPYIV